MTTNGEGSARVTPSTRDLRLGHRLQQRRLGLRGRPVDLVGEQQMGEDRSGPEHELAGALVVDGAPVMSEGSRSGVNCMRRKSRPEHGREGPREQRLAESGHVLDQHVAAGEDAEHDQFQRGALADDGALDLVEDGVGAHARLLGRQDGGVLLAHGGHGAPWRTDLRMVAGHGGGCGRGCVGGHGVGHDGGRGEGRVHSVSSRSTRAMISRSGSGRRSAGSMLTARRP